MKKFPLMIFAVCAALGHAAHAAGDSVNGKTLYQARCAACHAVDFNGAGPAHRGVFGRLAGKAAGFAYSPGLKASGLVWSEPVLDRWLADPEKLVPGQRMGVSVLDAQERADLIAYLKLLTAKE
jgi:cytochrome c